jgi:hypothetical protein
MAGFSRSKKASDPCEACANACRRRFAERNETIEKSREKIRYQKTHGGDQVLLKKLERAVDRFDQYNEAMVRARAAENVYHPDKEGECLTNLSNDTTKLSKELGFPLNEADFRNDETGFRAALYRSESNGRYILAFSGTNPHSLADWQTNIDNGRGDDTKQYAAARELAKTLAENGIPFDIAGHSKGGGMATEAGLVAGEQRVWTFNSAGLHGNSLQRTGASNFADVAGRTEAFHTEGDFLTMLQEESDPSRQIKDAEYLRKSLDGSWYKFDPIKITEADNTGKDVDKDDKKAFIKELDRLIADAKKKQKEKKEFDLFPSAIGKKHSLGDSGITEPGLRALNRHTMSSVISDLEKGKRASQDSLTRFLANEFAHK